MLVLRARKRQLAAWLAILLPVIMTRCTQDPRVTLLTNEAYFDALISHLSQAKQEIVSACPSSRRAITRTTVPTR